MRHSHVSLFPFVLSSPFVFPSSRSSEHFLFPSSHQMHAFPLFKGKTRESFYFFLSPVPLFQLPFFPSSVSLFFSRQQMRSPLCALSLLFSEDCNDLYDDAHHEDDLHDECKIKMNRWWKPELVSLCHQSHRHQPNLLLSTFGHPTQLLTLHSSITTIDSVQKWETLGLKSSSHIISEREWWWWWREKRETFKRDE